MEQLDAGAEGGRDCRDCVCGGGVGRGVFVSVPCAEEEEEDGEGYGEGSERGWKEGKGSTEEGKGEENERAERD